LISLMINLAKEGRIRRLPIRIADAA